MAAGGLRLANASGVNMNAVSDHAMALMLGLMRQLHVARDNQRKHHWRGMISNRSEREDELAGGTVLIIGMGAPMPMINTVPPANSSSRSLRLEIMPRQ